MLKQDINQKIIDNEKLVYFVINRHFPDLRRDEDIIQQGRIGLWKACESYDDGKSKFSTFAVKCIFNEIMREIRHRAKERRLGYAVSLDEVIGTEEDSDSEITIGSSIPFIEEGYCIVDHDLSSVVKKMSERNAEVFGMYIYGFSATEISQIFGFSRTWASNIIKDAQYIARKELLWKG